MPVRRGGMVAAAAAIAVVAAACGGDGGGSATSRTAGKASPGNEAGRAQVGATEWVAVFETAADPDDLEQQQAELLQRVEGAILVGPAGCHQGLSQALDVDRGTYVLGVVAVTQQRMEDAVERAGRDPIFEGELKLLCGAS